MTIYKSSEGKAKILALYDAQLQRLQHPYVYLLKGRGHMHFLTEQERSMIVDFLKQ